MATEAKIDAVTMAYAKVCAMSAIMSVHKISPLLRLMPWMGRENLTYVLVQK
jgi:hypothetical protein